MIVFDLSQTDEAESTATAAVARDAVTDGDRWQPLTINVPIHLAPNLYCYRSEWQSPCRDQYYPAMTMSSFVHFTEASAQ